MKYSIDAVRRHPAYKHGFECHAQFKRIRDRYGSDRAHTEVNLTTPAEFNKWQTMAFDDSHLSLYALWLAGAHAGMGNSDKIQWNEGENNWPPLYDREYSQKQLLLF